ncbi:MAG: GreA/GreB family elongation factor [Steroidobacteraceae bacterium]
MDLTPVISRLDAMRLRSLLASDKDRGLNGYFLEEKLNCATLVDAGDLMSDRVAVNATVLVREDESNVCWIYSLVLPAHADVRRGRISVASSLGAALLGHRTGDEIDWRVSPGPVRLKIEAVRRRRNKPSQAISATEWLLLA